ncbi:MAG: hypothetical protein R3F13_14545 [Prosthecobacter sp.]
MNMRCYIQHRSHARYAFSSAAWLPVVTALALSFIGFHGEARAQCSLCGKKRIGFGMQVPAGCGVQLTYGEQNQNQSFTADSLPKTVTGFVNVDMNSGAVPVTSATCGLIKDVNVKATLTQFPFDKDVSVKTTFSGCALKTSKSKLSLWHYAAFDPGQPSEAACTCIPSSTIPGTEQVDAHWEDVGTLEGVGYATQEEAQDALDALQANNNDTDRVEGSVSGENDGTWGFSAVRQHFVPMVPASDPVEDPGMEDPNCPVHGTEGPPDPEDTYQPPEDQTTDEMKIGTGLPGTGTGGGEGGSLGEGGVSIQPAPPPGLDEDPQLLPMS